MPPPKGCLRTANASKFPGRKMGRRLLGQEPRLSCQKCFGRGLFTQELSDIFCAERARGEPTPGIHAAKQQEVLRLQISMASVEAERVPCTSLRRSTKAARIGSACRRHPSSNVKHSHGTESSKFNNDLHTDAYPVQASGLCM